MLKGGSLPRKEGLQPKGVTPFLRKKENMEDKKRVNELQSQLEENN